MVGHSLSPGYKPGDHWAVCDRCGFDFRSSKLRKEWTGAIVCSNCWEPRHPQDFIRAVKDDQSPKGLVNPEPEDTFVTVTYDTDATDNPEAQIPSGTFNNQL
jgi:hypothetical protein